jgi:hypothetical protein
MTSVVEIVILLFPLKLTDLLFHSFGHVTSINLQQKLRVRVMVFNATFCNISDILMMKT